ncbi:hypothetical protein BC940DRAFT_333772 [Gongronella butleri]|nr:hypothetical protein BC940DRAFT_333772 [Gongronella butleri]
MPQRPTGELPVPGEDLVVKTSSIDLDAPLADSEFIVKNLELSIDPFLIACMKWTDFPWCYAINSVIAGYSAGVVVRSANEAFQVGDYVCGLGRFEEYSKHDGESAKKHALAVRNQPKATGLPLSNYVGALGLAGHTAYGGLIVGDIKPGQTIFVSGASGAVGQIASQVAKARGLKVVVTAGSEAKCEQLRAAGLDGVINYKTEDVNKRLGELCPEGLDAYFDNVGGQMLDIALVHLKPHSIAIECGMISDLNKEGSYSFKNLNLIIRKSIRLQGFVVNDYYDRELEFIDEVGKLMVEGRVRYTEDTRYGIEAMPQGLIDVLQGNFEGKVVIHINDE